jgi:hypothetical protein
LHETAGGSYRRALRQQILVARCFGDLYQSIVEQRSRREATNHALRRANFNMKLLTLFKSTPTAGEPPAVERPFRLAKLPPRRDAKKIKRDAGVTLAQFNQFANQLRVEQARNQSAAPGRNLRPV